jgi:hypothetical protein
MFIGKCLELRLSKVHESICTSVQPDRQACRMAQRQPDPDSLSVNAHDCMRGERTRPSTGRSTGHASGDS